MAVNLLHNLFGSKSEREIEKILTIVDEINTIYESLPGKSDDELVARTLQFRAMIRERSEEAEEAGELDAVGESDVAGESDVEGEGSSDE